MRAAVQRRYGPLDLLNVQEVERPTPKHDEVLVRVRAAAVTLSETITRKGRPLVARFFTGLLRPRRPIPGSEFAGRVEAVGEGVTRFREGDEVFGSTGSDAGCFAEFVCIPEDGFLAIKPANMTYEEAAPVCGALAAWNFLCEKAHVREGQRVLVNGAAGSIGTSAIQLAKHFGAEVTAVCGATDLELVRSLGADEAIDRARHDFTKSGETYDIIFDADSESSFARSKGSLAEEGMYLRTFPGPAILFQMLWTSKVGRKKAVVSATGLRPVSERLAFLDELTRLIETGEVRTVVDRRFPLDQITDAYRYAEGGHRKGSVVVAPQPEC